MAENVEIKCINKPDRNDPNTRILAVGGFHGGQRWRLSLDEAIAADENGVYKFWTVAGGKSVWVNVAERNGHKYLKTEADGDYPNNLLSLQECP